MTSRWLDSPQRYGLVTRLLHWSIALMFAWQFTGMGVKLGLGRHPLTAFMLGTHKPLGTVLLLLIAARALWAFSQWQRRPPHPANWIGKAASAGHALLYALMLYVPAVALLREYGGTRSFTPWGVPLFSGQAQEVAWMVAPGNASHGLLGWVLLALILGHVAMALLHHWWMRDDTLARMAGRLQSRQAAPQPDPIGGDA